MPRSPIGAEKKSAAAKTRDFEARQKARGRVQKHLWVHSSYAPLLELYAAECRAREERGEPPPAAPPVIRPKLSDEQIAMIQGLFDGKADALFNRFIHIIEGADHHLLERMDTRLALFEDQLRPVTEKKK